MSGPIRDTRWLQSLWPGTTKVSSSYTATSYTKTSKGRGCNSKPCIYWLPRVKWQYVSATVRGFSFSDRSGLSALVKNPTFLNVQPTGEWSLHPPRKSAERRWESRLCYSSFDYSQTLSINFNPRPSWIKENGPREEDVRAVKEF